MNNYKIRTTKSAQKKLKKWINKNLDKKNILNGVFQQLETNPYHPGLKSHPIISSKTGKKATSSRVDGELRIIWNIKESEIIIIFDFGTHKEVYK